MKTEYTIEFYPLIMIERAESKEKAIELAIEDIRMGECVLEVKKVIKEQGGEG